MSVSFGTARRSARLMPAVSVASSWRRSASQRSFAETKHCHFMLPSSALPTDAIHKLVHQVHETPSHRSRIKAPPGGGGSAKINFTPAMPPGWLAKIVSGVALFEEM